MKVLSLFGLLALCVAPQQVSAECVAVVELEVKDHGCPNANALGNQAVKVMRDAIRGAVEEVLNVTIDTSNQEFRSIFLGEETVFTGDERRQLTAGESDSTSDLVSFDLEAQSHRELGGCPSGGNVGACGGQYWCCKGCFNLGHGCSRRAMEDLFRSFGRELDATTLESAICAKVDDIVANKNGIGCLKGATVNSCGYSQETRKAEIDTDTEAASPGPLENSGSSASVFNFVVPVALGVAGLQLMA